MFNFQQEEGANVPEVDAHGDPEMYDQVPVFRIHNQVHTVFQIVSLKKAVDAPEKEVIHCQVRETSLK